MRAVRHLVVHEYRARWRGWALLALLVAVTGGAALTTAAGARRTDSAYPRFLAWSKASDVLVSPAGSGLTGYYTALARLPGVAALAPFVGLNVQPIGRGGRLDEAAAVGAPPDHRFGHLLEVPKVLAGHLPAAGQPGEVAVSQNGAAALHLHVGSTLAMQALPNGGLPGSSAAPKGAPRPLRLTEQVVGIIVNRASVDPVTDLDKVPFIEASTALLDKLGPGYVAFDGAYVKLRPGASLARFGAQAQLLTRRFPATGGQIYTADEGTQAATVERAIRPEAVALAFFALVLAVTALLIVGQAAVRLLITGSSDNPTLAALGMTRGQLAAAGLAEVGIAAIAGGLAAVGVAVAASPLMPIGAARVAEPAPGISADWVVLPTGAAAIMVLLLARVAWPAWRLGSAGASGASESAATGRRSLAAQWLAGAGAPVTATAGVRLALEPGRGGSAVPLRSALAGTALSVLAVATAFTFGANLLHLVHTPRLYGQGWDAAIDLQFSTITPAQTERLLSRAAGVSGWSFGDHGIIGVGGSDLVVPAIGMAAGRGPLLAPTLLEGRAPRTGHEIVLGTSVLRRIGRHVGQSVTVTVNGRREVDRIVGRAVFPNFGQGSFTPTDLGQGAETTATVLQAQAVPSGARPGYEFVLMRFTPGTRRAADMVSVTRSMAAYCATAQQTTCLLGDQRPNGVTNYAGIDGTPDVLAGLLAVLGLAVLGQLIVVSSRRRRRDFAIMKVLGMVGRQVAAVTAWQVTILTSLALLAGLPLGVALGRWAWMLFGNELGLPGEAIVPVTLVLLIAPVVILVANAVAYWPARTASRLSPAEVLRTE
jgi:hypothetical protein